MANPNPSHKFPKGNNFGGRPPKVQELQDFCREQTPAVLNTLMVLLKSKKTTSSTKLEIAKLMLAYGYGKPALINPEKTPNTPPILQFFPAQPNPQLEAYKAELRASGDLPEEHKMPDIAALLAQAALQPAGAPTNTPAPDIAVPATVSAPPVPYSPESPKEGEAGEVGKPNTTNETENIHPKNPGKDDSTSHLG